MIVAPETKLADRTTAAAAARLRQTSFLKLRNSNSTANGFGTVFKFNDLPKLPPLHLVPRNFYEGRGPAFSGGDSKIGGGNGGESRFAVWDERDESRFFE